MRNYGIDLLRLVLMYMVCMLHTLGQGGILASYSQGTLEYGLFWSFEVITFAAVNSFAIISGYTAKEQKQDYSKIVNLWIQTVFYSLILTVILARITPLYGFTPGEYVTMLFPVTNEKYWYITAYFGLFFLMPFLKKALFSVDEKAAKKILLVLLIVAPVLELIHDIFKLSGGYSVIWLAILYAIGLLSKRVEIFKNRKTVTLIIWWFILNLITWADYMSLGDKSKLLSYISPTVLLSGLLLVVIFSRFKLKGKIISKLSPLALGIYLFQLNVIVWNVLEGKLSEISEKGLLMSIVIAFGFAFLLFAAGLFVDFIRSLIHKGLKIDVLCKKIAGLIDKGLEKAGNILN